MYVRRSNMEDIPAMMDLYAQARVFMRENGNPNQWDENYPSRELLEKDIAFGNSYIVEDDEKNLAATFAFIKGEDPTYYGIENGAWLNHEPYGTIHRLAGNTSYHGIASGCISWCKSQIGNLRADTHEDNKIMQHLLEKNGFVRCGIIHLANGAPRIAYQFAGDRTNYRGSNEQSQQNYNQPNRSNQPMQNQNWSVREVSSGGRGFGIPSRVLGIGLILFLREYSTCDSLDYLWYHPVDEKGTKRDGNLRDRHEYNLIISVSDFLGLYVCVRCQNRKHG